MLDRTMPGPRRQRLQLSANTRPIRRGIPLARSNKPQNTLTAGAADKHNAPPHLENAMSSAMLRSLAVSVGLLMTPAMAAGESQATPPDPALAANGELLFNDTSLSGGGNVSCATCHFSTGHTNNKTYVGLDVVANGDPNGRSTPTLWGAGERSVYSWAGTAPTLEESIHGIIVNRMKGAEPPKETLSALAAYVRSLPTPKNWQLNDDGTPSPAATDAVKRGFALFTGEGGCGTCHVLPNLDKPNRDDIGTGGRFKVPSLRSVGSTAPYFHDGREQSLREAVKFMWGVYAKKMDTGHVPTDAELDDLVAYVGAL
jgi:cytochrome c peroxidase